jgi:hypothetical protein
MFELEPSDLQLLAWQIPNEVVNGFKVEDFNQRVGIPKEEFKTRAIRLRGMPEEARVTLSAQEVSAFRNALSLTLDELGIDEFQTRTGFDFEVGLQLLRKMNRFLESEQESDS